MKTAKIRTLLDAELSSITPVLSKKVTKVAIAQPANKKKKGEMYMAKSNTNKKIAIGAIAACCVIALTLGLVFGLKDKNAYAESYVVLDINPSIEMVVDENQIVTSVSAANEDAQVLLYNETGIVGSNVEVATEKLLQLSVECGYLDESNAEINVYVSADLEKIQKKVNEQVSAAINKGVGDLQLSVSNAVSYLVSHEVEKWNEAHPKNKVDAPKYKLMLAAVNADRTITMLAASEMTNEQLTAIVKDAHARYEEQLTAAYKLAYQAAVYAYENGKATAMDGVYYTEINDGTIFGSAARTLNCTKYVSYRLAARSLGYAADLIQEYRKNPVFTQTDIAKFTGVTVEQQNNFIAKVGEYGEISKQNMVKYINKLSEDVAANSAELNVALTIYDQTDEYATTTANVNINSANIQNLISSGLSQIAQYIAGFTIKTVTLEDINNTIASLNQKADEALTAMELTDAEKQSVSEKQQALADDITAMENTFKAAIEQAKTASQEALKAKKIEVKAQAQIKVSQNGNGNS